MMLSILAVLSCSGSDRSAAFSTSFLPESYCNHNNRVTRFKPGLSKQDCPGQICVQSEGSVSGRLFPRYADASGVEQISASGETSVEIWSGFNSQRTDRQRHDCGTRPQDDVEKARVFVQHPREPNADRAELSWKQPLYVLIFPVDEQGEPIDEGFREADLSYFGRKNRVSYCTDRSGVSAAVYRRTSQTEKEATEWAQWDRSNALDSRSVNILCSHTHPTAFVLEILDEELATSRQDFALSLQVAGSEARYLLVEPDEDTNFITMRVFF